MRRRLIGITYQVLVKPLLFRRDPETVHDFFTKIGRWLGSNRVTKSITRFVFSYQNESYLSQEVAGIRFTNPVGLSAGFDKDANLQNIMPDVGFGFMQIGSVTLHPYEGNPKPRLYRLPNSSALVVNYGLKNIGVERISEKLKRYSNPNFPLSISIAKTNSKEASTLQSGAEDYTKCLEYLINNDIGDFYTINISCPNTFGGEPFTDEESLELLLSKLSSLNLNKPLFVKMPINLELKDFDKLLQVCVKYKITGVVIGNLTKVRDPHLIHDSIPEGLKGGISGKPTEELCNSLIAYTYQNYSEKLIIVGVGGIFSAEGAYTKIKLGATLVQLITGMVYQGPQLIGEINEGLVRMLKQDGYENVREAVGAQFKSG